MSLITVENVWRTYTSSAGEVHALRDISFEVAAGQLVALVGRSGSGKTTLLNCIGGLDQPTSGTVTINGSVVTDMDENQRTRLRRDELAFVFQTFGLVPMLSARENVGLPLRLRYTYLPAPVSTSAKSLTAATPFTSTSRARPVVSMPS